MDLHTKVIKYLEQNSGYDFNENRNNINSTLRIIYDAVKATEKILNEKPLQTSERLPESKL